MIHELRIYDAMPGKLPALHRRFQEITLGFFARHGIHVVGFWDTVVGTSNQLHYIVEFDSLADRERKWDAFASDLEWLKARAETERDGPLAARITNVILRPTAYSPMK